jgi:GDPmannose 4,6-dehydratase
LKKIVIITGISGQDGAYLSKFLLDKKYTVIGLVRSINNANLEKLTYLNIKEKIVLKECDLADLAQVIDIINESQPVEIYNLAAQSSVALSFEYPIETLQYNINSVINLLEAIRLVDRKIKFYQASSSEMYGRVNQLPINEESLIHPVSPYAISKVTGHLSVINYRESYGLFACCGILFNHESYLRGNNFFIKKLLKGALDLHSGKRDFLEFGNLEIKRDFGYSPDYVQAMWLMMQQPVAEEFLICSGTSITLKSIVYYVLDKLKIPRDVVKINLEYFRPNEIEDIYGENAKAIKILKWNINHNFYNTLDILLEEEIKNYGN